jgi:PLP dependent protein
MIQDLRTRLDDVLERIHGACVRGGRDPSEVRLVAVSKTQPVDVVAEAIDAGIALFGENYIQEAEEKISALGRQSAAWHFIGRLQSNKAKFAVRLFDLIHSVDTVKLARELDKRAGVLGLRQPVLVQVNISGETTKGGVDTGGAEELIGVVNGLDHLDVRGLMTMPPFFDQPERARPYFRALRELKDRIGPPLTELSMGMSGDFEVAIEEGATLVRVGTAIFGMRSSR